MSAAKANSLMKVKRRKVQVLDEVTPYAKWERVFASRKQTLMLKACELEISTGSEVTIIIRNKYGDSCCYTASDDLYKKLMKTQVILQTCSRVNNEVLYKNYYRMTGIHHKSLDINSSPTPSVTQSEASPILIPDQEESCEASSTSAEASPKPDVEAACWSKTINGSVGMQTPKRTDENMNKAKQPDKEKRTLRSSKVVEVPQKEAVICSATKNILKQYRSPTVVLKRMTVRPTTRGQVNTWENTTVKLSGHDTAKPEPRRLTSCGGCKDPNTSGSKIPPKTPSVIGFATILKNATEKHSRHDAPKPEPSRSASCDDSSVTSTATTKSLIKSPSTIDKMLEATFQKYSQHDTAKLEPTITTSCDSSAVPTTASKKSLTKSPSTIDKMLEATVKKNSQHDTAKLEPTITTSCDSSIVTSSASTKSLTKSPTIDKIIEATVKKYSQHDTAKPEPTISMLYDSSSATTTANTKSPIKSLNKHVIQTKTRNYETPSSQIMDDTDKSNKSSFKRMAIRVFTPKQTLENRSSSLKNYANISTASVAAPQKDTSHTKSNSNYSSKIQQQVSRYLKKREMIAAESVKKPVHIIFDDSDDEPIVAAKEDSSENNVLKVSSDSDSGTSSSSSSGSDYDISNLTNGNRTSLTTTVDTLTSIIAENKIPKSRKRVVETVPNSSDLQLSKKTKTDGNDSSSKMSQKQPKSPLVKLSKQKSPSQLKSESADSESLRGEAVSKNAVSKIELCSNSGAYDRPKTSESSNLKKHGKQTTRKSSKMKSEKTKKFKCAKTDTGEKHNVISKKSKKIPKKRLSGCRKVPENQEQVNEKQKSTKIEDADRDLSDKSKNQEQPTENCKNPIRAKEKNVMTTGADHTDEAHASKTQSVNQQHVRPSSPRNGDNSFRPTGPVAFDSETSTVKIENIKVEPQFDRNIYWNDWKSNCGEYYRDQGVRTTAVHEVHDSKSHPSRIGSYHPTHGPNTPMERERKFFFEMFLCSNVDSDLISE